MVLTAHFSSLIIMLFLLTRVHLAFITAFFHGKDKKKLNFYFTIYTFTLLQCSPSIFCLHPEIILSTQYLVLPESVRAILSILGCKQTITFWHQNMTLLILLIYYNLCGRRLVVNAAYLVVIFGFDNAHIQKFQIQTIEK